VLGLRVESVHRMERRTNEKSRLARGDDEAVPAASRLPDQNGGQERTEDTIRRLGAARPDGAAGSCEEAKLVPSKRDRS
jgi:hypothetical protein